MWVGEGERDSRHQVTFTEAYQSPPAVMIGLSMWDMDNRTNLRAHIAAEEVTESGFQIVFRTWGDSRIARVRADWTAIGQLADSELWNVG